MRALVLGLSRRCALCAAPHPRRGVRAGASHSLVAPPPRSLSTVPARLGHACTCACGPSDNMPSRSSDLPFSARDAVTATDEDDPKPRSRAPPFAAYCLAFASFGLAANSLGPLMPKLALQAHVSPFQMSPLLLAGGLGGILGALACPSLPLPLLLPGGMAALAATYACVPFASDVASLAAVYGVASICAQGVAVGANASVAGGGPAGGATMRLNAINAAFGFGSLLAPLLHDKAGDTFPGVTAYWLLSGVLLAASSPFLSSATLAQQAAHAAASSPPSLSIASLGGPSGAALTATIALLVACSVGAEVSFASWLFTHASQGPCMLPGDAAAVVVSTFWGCLTAGRLMAALAASRGAQPSHILRVTLPLAVAGPLVALSAPSSATALSLGVALSGLGLSTGFANAVALLAKHVPPSASTQALLQLAACSGAILFPPLAGALSTTSLGTSACLLVAGACAAADMGCLLAAERMGRRLTDGARP